MNDNKNIASLYVKYGKSYNKLFIRLLLGWFIVAAVLMTILFAPIFKYDNGYEQFRDLYDINYGDAGYEEDEIFELFEEQEDLKGENSFDAEFWAKIDLKFGKSLSISQRYDLLACYKLDNVTVSLMDYEWGSYSQTVEQEMMENFRLLVLVFSFMYLALPLVASIIFALKNKKFCVKLCQKLYDGKRFKDDTFKLFYDMGVVCTLFCAISVVVYSCVMLQINNTHSLMKYLPLIMVMGSLFGCSRRILNKYNVLVDKISNESNEKYGELVRSPKVSEQEEDKQETKPISKNKKV